MNRTVRGLIQLLALVAIAFGLLRLFPLMLRLSEIAALSLGSFWWVVLALALGAWLIWVLRKRNSG